MTDFQVSDLGEARDAIQQAVAAKTRLELVAAGTKRHLGRSASYDAVLDTSAMAGIIDYQDAVELAKAEKNSIFKWQRPAGQ